MLTAPANHIPANNPILTYPTFLGALPTAAYQGYNHSPSTLNPVCTPLLTPCALRSQPRVDALQLIIHIDHQ